MIRISLAHPQCFFSMVTVGWGWMGYGHPMPLGHDHPPRAQLVRWDLEHMDRKSPWLKQRDLRFPPTPQTMDGPRPIEIIYQTSKIVFSIAMFNCLRLTTNFWQQNVSSYQKISKKEAASSWRETSVGVPISWVRLKKTCSDFRAKKLYNVVPSR